MFIFLYITITFFYGILSIRYVTKKMNKRRETILESSNLATFVGSILVISSNLRWILDGKIYIVFLLMGLSFIHIATCLTSYQLIGRINPSQHIARGIISFLLLCIYFITL